MIEATPRIITGIFTFTGAGFGNPVVLSGLEAYKVPADRRSQLVYLRAGNSADEMVSLVLLRDGSPMRLFPLGAKSGQHVPLAVVEDLFPETTIEMRVAAPEGVSGTVVIDMGLMEI
ncbi:molybdopterin oxidoreductase [Lichenicoccus roseus]|uniref:Molybdopterin oxidoreductase n=1 Tax=Lichenicoccus roseus TaxID=2683649 RepID=A0A5R9J2Y6_9PROT|nr:molybdopterin oxidoreductase [Lichenicoccus roseus]TLU72000.1 molybdopterin oxidoreductase [Lichenicoccus roseus]